MSNIKNILVTGANGQLGNECRVLANARPEIHFVFVDREDFSISDKSAVDALFTKHSFDACINCAAYTAVDLAEKEKEAAYQTNAEAVGYLAEACKKNNALFIHISTDYVFDGSNANGYDVDDATGPLNVYGESKLAGEIIALEKNPESIVIRTAWVYSSFGNNFVKTMMRLMKERESIGVVDDQIGSPTYAADLAEAIFTIISSEKKIPGGVYHYTNEGVISWHEFALAINEIGGYTFCKVNPIPSSAYPVPAKRPSYSILKKDKIKSVLGITIPHWKDSLIKCMHLLQK